MKWKGYLRGELVGGIIGTLTFLIVLTTVFYLRIFSDVDWDTIIVFAIIDIVAGALTVMLMFRLYSKRILRRG